MPHLISPSILNADFGKLQANIEMLNKSSADWVHLDIMDGVFVPNLTFGFPIIKQINTWSNKPLDVHLMIIEPDRYIEQFKESGANILTVHQEACPHLHRTIQKIKQNDMKAGIALNPHTPSKSLSEIITDVDMVLIMSVNPGFGKQKFIENTYRKIEETKELIEKSGSSAIIQVDGGVNMENAKNLLNSGVDVLVAGNAIFGSEDAKSTISSFKNITA